MIKQLEIGPMGNFAYIVGDEKSKTCAVIDPGWETDEIIKQASDLCLKITHILLTHSHFDHAKGAKSLSIKTGAPIYIHESEIGDEAKSFKSDDIIPVGSLKFNCFHTPGHSPGSTCFILDDAIFTGDALFVGAIGRTDLDGGSDDDMLESLRKLASLPDKLVVYPGHNYGDSPTSTIGEQKRTNPYLRK